MLLQVRLGVGLEPDRACPWWPTTPASPPISESASAHAISVRSYLRSQYRAAGAARCLRPGRGVRQRHGDLVLVGTCDGEPRRRARRPSSPPSMSTGSANPLVVVPVPAVAPADASASRVAAGRGGRRRGGGRLGHLRVDRRAVLADRRQRRAGGAADEHRARRVDRAALDAVDGLVDLAHARGAGAGTGAALADHHDHGVLGLVRRREGGEPRRRLVARARGLTGSGLGRDRDLVEGEAAEGVVAGAVGLARSPGRTRRAGTRGAPCVTGSLPVTFGLMSETTLPSLPTMPLATCGW